MTELVPVTDDGKRLLEAPEGVEWTTVSLHVVDPAMTYERLERITFQVRDARDATAWWLGDLLLYAEGLFGEKYAQMMEATGLSYSRLTQIASTCKQVVEKRRRVDLSFGHHEEVASLDPDSQVEWLAAAADSGWSVSQLREALREGGTIARREPRSPSEAAAAAGSKQAAATVDAARNLSVVGETLELVQKALGGEDPDPQKTVTELDAILPKAMRALEEASMPVRQAASSASLATVAHDVVKSATVSGGFAMVPIDVFESFKAAVAAG